MGEVAQRAIAPKCKISDLGAIARAANFLKWGGNGVRLWLCDRITAKSSVRPVSQLFQVYIPLKLRIEEFELN